MTPTQAIERLRMYFPRPDWALGVCVDLHSHRQGPEAFTVEFGVWAGSHNGQGVNGGWVEYFSSRENSVEKAVAQIISQRSPKNSVASRVADEFAASAAEEGCGQ